MFLIIAAFYVFGTFLAIFVLNVDSPYDDIFGAIFGVIGALTWISYQFTKIIDKLDNDIERDKDK